MSDTWWSFWKDSPLAYEPGVNLRPASFDYHQAAAYYHHLLGIRPTDKALDVGCGNGMLLKELAPYTQTMSGCDYSENMVKLASQILVNEKITGEVKCAPFTHLPFSDNEFDRVLCLSVIQYAQSLEEAQQAVKEMLRVAKPGGKVLIGDIFDKRRFHEEGSGTAAFTPEELGQGQYKELPGYYEPERRFDLLFVKS